MSAQNPTQSGSIYLFGPFSLSAKKRLLAENGQPVPLGSRALEMLIVLTEKRGELVTKDELLARVWPTTVVVEGNLTAQMVALRRALHDGRDANRFIVNEPGRGYRFVAPVIVAEEPGPAPAAAFAEQLSGVIGSAPKDPPSSGQHAIDGILRQGIQALELARTLVASSDVNANHPPQQE